jgi:hypothetical protein
MFNRIRVLASDFSIVDGAGFFFMAVNEVLLQLKSFGDVGK